MEIFNSPGDSKDLELELAAFVDGGNCIAPERLH